MTKAQAIKQIRRIMKNLNVSLADLAGGDEPELPADLITTTQAAEILGVTPGHTRHLVKIGELQAFRHGRDNLVSRAAVEAYVRKPVGPRPKKREATTDKE